MYIWPMRPKEVVWLMAFVTELFTMAFVTQHTDSVALVIGLGGVGLLLSGALYAALAALAVTLYEKARQWL